MAKIGAKEAALAALRARKAAKPAKTTAPKRSKPVRTGGKVGKKAKRSVASKKRPLPRKAVVAQIATGPATPPPSKLGRPSTGFDRRAYQRVYCRNRLKYGTLPSWPADAVAELAAVKSTPKSPC